MEVIHISCDEGCEKLPFQAMRNNHILYDKKEFVSPFYSYTVIYTLSQWLKLTKTSILIGFWMGRGVAY